MINYYARHAAEYEKIYEKAERQKDLQSIKTDLSCAFKGVDVLEVACGTGYWAEYIAKSAGSVLGTDYNELVLAVAKTKPFGPCEVRFQKEDAFSLDGVDGVFNGGFSGF